MAKRMQSEARKAVKTVARRARARRSASAMKPEYLAELEQMRLMDDTSKFKNSEEGRHYMCEAMERIEARGKLEGRREGERKGRREGKRETMLAAAMRMLKDGALALKDIARYSGLSLAQVKKLQMEL